MSDEITSPTRRRAALIFTRRARCRSGAWVTFSPRGTETVEFLWQRGYRLHAKVGVNVIMQSENP